MIAAQKGKNRIVKILLEEKADPNIQAMVLWLYRMHNNDSKP